MTTIIPRTVKEAEAYAASEGFVFTATERAAIAQAQADERKRLMSLSPAAKLGWIARWNLLYPRLLQAVVSLGETLLTFSQTVIVSLGVPIVLVLLLIVEHQRVVHGIALFETDEHLASFAGMALVLLNLVLEFQIHHIEHAAGYIDEQRRRWSLNLWWQSARYVTGLGYDEKKGEVWEPQYISPADRYKKLLSLVTFSILILALVGSMKGVIEEQDGTWYQAMGDIVTQSDLKKMLTWIGGALFAAAAVKSAQGLSRYVAIRCVEIIRAMQTQNAAAIDPFESDVDESGALFALGIINAKKAKAEEKAAKVARKAEPAPLPEQQPQPYIGEVAPAVPTPFGNTAHAWELDNPSSSAKTVAPGNTPMIAPLDSLVGTAGKNGNGRHS